MNANIPTVLKNKTRIICFSRTNKKINSYKTINNFKNMVHKR